MESISDLEKVGKKSENYRKISKNFIALVLLQVTNFVIPILIIPHLIKTLGIDKFGIVSLAQTTMIYLFVIVDYGFSLSAVKNISLNKNNLSYLNKLFSEVMMTKIFLGIISFFILLLVVCIYPKFIENWKLLLLSYFMVLGQLILPTWFYQGIDAMKYTTITNLVSKVIFTVFIFIFIRTPNDDLWVNLLLGCGNCIAGLISIAFLSCNYKINISIKQGIKGIKYQLLNGWYYFLSSFSASVYANSNIVILGLFANSHVLGIYSIAEKVAILVRQVLVVFSQAIYTYVCLIVESKSIDKVKSFIREIFVPFFCIICLGCGILFFFCHLIPIYLKMTIKDSEYFILLIRILCIVPIIVCLNIPFFQFLLTYNNAKNGSFILTFGAVISIIANIILASKFSALGTATTIVIVELILTLSTIMVASKTASKVFKM